MNVKSKGTFAIILSVVFLICLTVGISAAVMSDLPEYRVGYMSDGSPLADNYDAVRQSFSDAYGNFAADNYAGKAVSDVTYTNGWYSQDYADEEGRRASIYVGGDNNAYTISDPLYSAWSTFGGVNSTGYPTSNATSVNGSYYQNFTNGYFTLSGDGTPRFVSDMRIDESGKEMSLNGYGNHGQTATENNQQMLMRDRSVRNSAGVGADASGIAGSLETVNSGYGAGTTISVIALIALAALIILLVAFGSVPKRT